KRSVQLSQARGARVYKSTKRAKINVGSSSSHAHNGPSNDRSNRNHSDKDESGPEPESEEPVCYCNNSANDEISDSDQGKKGDIISDSDADSDSNSNSISEPTPAQPLPTVQPPSITHQPSKLVRWKEGADAKLRGRWGAGSQATKERQLRNAREFQIQASQCYSIKAMFEQRQNTGAETEPALAMIGRIWTKT
ncbi:hypothetical protein MMC07_006556, partial [Pseudocyphellaria aurata]|nr:hypothetical protein [Pseudocyphellaria aurata]